MKKYAIIDIGSNTIRLCIYQVQGHSFKLVAKKRNVAGLAAYVDRKASDVNRKYNLQEEGIEKLISVLQDFKVDDGLLVDIGGASTELVYFKNQKVVKSYSKGMAKIFSTRGSEPSAFYRQRHHDPFKVGRTRRFCPRP